jgi:hypothetical protein
VDSVNNVALEATTALDRLVKGEAVQVMGQSTLDKLIQGEVVEEQ